MLTKSAELLSARPDNDIPGFLCTERKYLSCSYLKVIPVEVSEIRSLCSFIDFVKRSLAHRSQSFDRFCLLKTFKVSLMGLNIENTNLNIENTSWINSV